MNIQTLNSIALSYWTNTPPQIPQPSSTPVSTHHFCRWMLPNRGTTFPINEPSRSWWLPWHCSLVDWLDRAVYRKLPEWHCSCKNLDFVMGTISCSNRRWRRRDRFVWIHQWRPSMQGSPCWRGREWMGKWKKISDMSALRMDQRSCFIERRNTYPLTQALAARSG